MKTKKTILRKGRTKSLVESSIDCALLAVEIYNKPRAPFKVECFITHMIMAWTRLFHAHFNHTIGETYFYKEENGRYKLIDGDKKAWELATCIKKYDKLSDSVKANLIFFIKLRNKIEHATIGKDDIGVMIFGECQSLLYNFESELIKLFGEEYALNESLAFSLQFSLYRTKEQKEANKKILSSEYKELNEFIKKYRNSLNENINNSQEFSIKLIQIPKISNTNKNDLAIEFVNLNNISDEDKKTYETINVIIKDKVIKKEAINPGKLKPGDVVKKVNEKGINKINLADLKYILSILTIRPYKSFNDNNYNAFQTNIDYCHYDEVHDDYLYQDSLVELIINIIDKNILPINTWKDKFNRKEVIEISEIESKIELEKPKNHNAK
ncbi:hypothetical protein SDC9_23310 [bioreactor metagenome]|uniref:DUF3644 domain-containing protein n=1 Tax=bioreactor metagenome TaxID=1076179 RepID=A0A644UEX3_9ZZZZ